MRKPSHTFEVCVVVRTGTLRRTVVVNFSTEDDTATGMTISVFNIIIL